MAPFINDEATPTWVTKFRIEGPMPIAVVGMSFRGPGDATSVENLWKMIVERREGRCEIPKDRWNNGAFYHPDPNRHGTHNVTAGHFMRQDVRKFDAPFFNMTAAEAAALDPVQRLLLEASFEAAENAGVPLEKFCGSETSVFAGAFATDYTDVLLRDPESLPMYQCTNAGFCRSNIANRLSYFYDLRGPSVAIDTACSTSLVALHLGCQSLWTGDAKQSLIAGASVMLGPEIMMTMSMMRMLSPDGRCYTFDSRANGYSRGEGVGCLLLKPLQDAVRDGDTIRAIIRGTGSNSDGRTQGITMPSKEQQEALIRSVYAKARIDPAETDFVECHGTGTPAGDPLETEAVSRAFCEDRQRQNPLRIGSVKTNIGHLEGASGVAGVIKAILMLENEVFLPNRNFETPSERIRFDDWKLTVPTRVEAWKKGSAPRRASVNSFGYGGSNAHVVLESAKDHLEGWGYTSCFRTTKSVLPSLSTESTPEGPRAIADVLVNGTHCVHGDGLANGTNHVNGDIAGNGTHHINGDIVTNGFLGSNGNVLKHGIHHVNGDIVTNGFDESNGEAAHHTASGRPRLFLLSGLDETVAKQQVENLKSFVEQRIDTADDRYLSDLAYTLGERRTTHLLKAVIRARTIDELVEAASNGIAFVRSPRKLQATLGFVFTGQGAQWAGMGRELIALYPVFRASLSTSSELLKRAGASFDLVVEMTKTKDSQINRALLSQPLCTGLQIALVDLLASWGIRPSSVTGHSSGEIAAAYAAGVLNQEDALLLAYQRGVCSARLGEQTPGRGSMLAVGMSKDDALPLIAGLTRGKAVLACSNSPSSITVSGDMAAIEELQSILTDKNIFNRRLVVEVAYHSHHMADVADDYRAAISGIKAHDADAYFYSSVKGARSAGSELGPDYWVANLQSEVKFAQSLQLLCSETGQAKKGRSRGAALDALLEIGPHSALAGPIRQTLEFDDKLKKASIPYHATLTRKKDAADCMLELASGLILAGFPILDKVNRPAGSGIPSLLIDLPPYSWNHNKVYWAEPRLSKAWLHRQHPKTDLLGVLEQNSSSLEPRWRNTIRPSELPWLRDHVIQSNIVFPGAGYIVMALEAALQRAKQRAVPSITGFKLREVVIGSALVIPEDTGQAEVAVTLKSYSESMRSPSDLWDEFLVTSISEDDRWTEHCRGLISVQTPPKAHNVVNGNAHEQLKGQGYEIFAAQYDSRSTKEIDVPQFYQKLHDLGLEYGETFAMMTEARSAPGRCLGRFKISDTAATMPMNYQSQLVVHPATIDALFHSIFAALSAQRGGLQSPAVPVSIEEINVSSDITNEPGEELVTFTTTTKKDHRLISADLDVFQGRDKKSVISIRDITCATLDNDDIPDPASDAPRKAYNFLWQPDVEMLSPIQVAALCQHEDAEEEMTNRTMLEQAALDSLTLALEQEIGSTSSVYQQHLYAFLESIRGRGYGQHPYRMVQDGPANDTLLSELRNSSAVGRLLCGIGSQLSLLLSGEMKPSDSPKKLDLSALFEALATMQGHKSAAKYINLLTHKKPDLSIFAVGSGSGLSAIALLTALADIRADAFGISTLSYADTDFDISDMLKAKSPAWVDLIHRKDFDMFASVLPQDEDYNSQDVILGLYHPAAPNTHLKNLLANSRKLLKGDGHLLLVDISNRPLIRDMLSACLCSTLDMSSTVFSKRALVQEHVQQTGFTELASMASDGLTILQPSTDENQVFPGVSVLLVTETCDLQIAVQPLLDLLSAKLLDFQKTTLDAACPTPNQVCMVLSNLTNDVLLDPSTAHFESLKRIMLQSAGVLWVSRGASSGIEPNQSIANGLTRSVRSETGTIPIVSLDLDAEKPLPEFDAAKKVFSVFEKHFLIPSPGLEPETEYAERDGVLHVPRLVEDNECEALLACPDRRKPEMQPFSQEGRPLCLEVGKPGLLNTMLFVDDEHAAQPLPSDYVDIEVHATGLNFKDVMMAMGQIKFEPLGLECSGIIKAVGDDAKEFMPGDRVVCYGHGAFCTDFRTTAARVQKIPDAMDFETAAAIPITYTTAYYAVHHLARLRKGESVLIHAATGGLGQALIEFGQVIDAEIFATVGTVEKKILLMERFKIPEDHIFFSRDGSYAEGIKRMTAGKGVDVVMNSLAGEGLRLTWDCVAPLGRFIELGQRDITVNSRLEMAPFIKNASFIAFNLVYLLEQHPAAANRAFADVISMFRVGALKGPSPLHVWSIEDIEKAFRIMQSGSHMGKLVAIPKPGAMVPVAPQDKSKGLLRPDASYLLAGGLGGIGRATAQWMVGHGARNLIFVNRSGEKGKDARDTVRLLRERGCNVCIIACDISDAPSVQNLAEQLKANMPPIRGMIQGAMVLRDGFFEKMPLENWQAVTRCKVQGTWNLHNYLSKDVDFFVMEASVSGIIGNATQANYAAANTFLDAFASLRHSQGLPATAIDLGAGDVGVLSGKDELRTAMERQGFDIIDEKTLMKIIQFAIENPRRKNGMSQIVTGLGTHREGSSPSALTLPMFSHARASSTQGAQSGRSSSAASLRSTLQSAKSLDHVSEIICAALIDKIAERSHMAPENIKSDKSLADYGVDSLSAVETRNWIISEMGSTVSILEMLGNNSLRALATKIAQRSRFVILEGKQNV